MKKLITLLVFAFAANSSFAQAVISKTYFGYTQASEQGLIAKTYVEHTHMTPKVGAAIGFQTDYGWEYGAPLMVKKSPH